MPDRRTEFLWLAQECKNLADVHPGAGALPDAVGPDAHPGADLRSGDSDLRTLYLDLRGYRIRAFIHAAPADAPVFALYRFPDAVPQSDSGSAAGVVGALLINLYGYLLDPDLLQKIFDIPATLLYRANVLCGWLSLLRHATFPLHNFGYDYLPRISVSVMIFLILTAVLLILSGVRMRNYNFTFIQVEE